MNEHISQLEARIEALEQKLSDQESANTIPLKLDQALQGRGFVKDKTLAENLANNASGTYYVATSSGGAVTHKIVFSNGILITP
jgi:hypothetical protein